jgi:microcin C transport system substrate-binding protein
LAYRESLKKLGIDLSVRMMDTVQYENRVTERNFDMIVHTWVNSLSPGTEQTYYFGKKSADEPGSSNYMGLKDPVAEGLAQLVADAKTSEEHTAAAHALDRYMMHQCYQVPLNYDPYARWAYWKKGLAYPEIDPKVGLNIINFGWSLKGSE